MPVEMLRFGVVTDCQYADIPTPPKSKRFYRLSPQKLQEAVTAFNTMGDLDFVIHLGDMVDLDFRSFSVVMPIFRKLEMPGYQCLGNHDYSVAEEEKAKVTKALDMPAPFYSYTIRGWRLIVIDGNDLSLFANPKDHPRTQFAKLVQNAIKPKPADYNGGVGQAQLSWLRNELDAAEMKQQPVLVFGHYPLLPADSHTLWNASALVSLLAEYKSSVKAFFCGHNHDGNYVAQHGIHFLNFHGMVDTPTNTYARLEATPDFIKVHGFGREPMRNLPCPAADYLPKAKAGG